MSRSKDDKRTPRERLASNDDAVGGGFPLPALIAAAVGTVMDAGEKGASLRDVIRAVGASDGNDERVRFVWRTRDLAQARERQTRDLLAELESRGVVHVEGDRVTLGNLDDARRVQATDDGGYRITLYGRANTRTAIGAVVYPEPRRSERRAEERAAQMYPGLMSDLNQFPMTDKWSKARIAWLMDSIRDTGFDPTKAPIAYRGPSGEMRIVAGRHRTEAARRLGIKVKPAHVLTDPLDAALAATRDQDSRRWKPSERAVISQRLGSNRTLTQQEMAERLNVSRRTVERDLRRGKSPLPPGRPAIKGDDPAIEAWVECHPEATRDQLVAWSKAGTHGWPGPGDGIGNGTVDKIRARLRGTARNRQVTVSGGEEPAQSVPPGADSTPPPPGDAPATTASVDNNASDEKDEATPKPTICSRCHGTGIEP